MSILNAHLKGAAMQAHLEGIVAGRKMVVIKRHLRDLKLTMLKKYLSFNLSYKIPALACRFYFRDLDKTNK